MRKNFTPLKAKKSFIFLAVFWMVMIAASETKAQQIWNNFAWTKTFNKNLSGSGQFDCITSTTCLTRITVLFNNICENITGMQGCGYLGPCNTEWAYGNINNWATLTYQRLYLVNGCIPPDMINNPLVLHILNPNVYLQVTFLSWSTGGTGLFSYIRTCRNAACTVLPVTVAAFSGRKSGNVHVLNWKSSFESNFSHYNVQRSGNGNDFLTIGRVDSKSGGNSSFELDYGFTDPHPAPGHNYYRLEQLDIDGKALYSKVIDLFNSNSGSTIDIRQNDGGVLVNINIAAVKSSTATINLVDMNGWIMQTINKGIVNGNNMVPVRLDNVAKGIYLVQVYEEGNLSFSGKVTRQL